MKRITPVLTVKSVYDSVEWYQSVLGFAPAYLNQQAGEGGFLDYAVLTCGTVSLHLGRELEMAVMAGNGGCHIDTEDFDALHQRAMQQGASFYLQLSVNPAGQRNFGIRDPDGNLIVVAEI